MSHAIYLLEAELQVALRTATKHLPLVARQKEGFKCLITKLLPQQAVQQGLHTPIWHKKP
ncbi:hypothetical protein [Pilibacter termitis]|uniref:hypothetical protein n=1 Tax=Pilibacter termitis TaxID=263852 RepID=UPI001186EBDC|nr:hypothetical protein [Pilibacter termitis]